MEVKGNMPQPPSAPPGIPVVMKVEAISPSGFHFSSGSGKTLLAGFLMLFLVGGVGAGVYLVGQQHQLNSKASTTVTQLPSNLNSVVPLSAVNPATDSAQASSSAQPAHLSSAEPSASSSSNLSQQYDFNGDGKTNSIDLSVMYSGWGEPKTDVQKKADLNADQVVNGLDYSLFLQHFN